MKYRHPDVARLLLDRGANPNGAPKWDGPLEWAQREHDRAMINLLLRRGAKPLPAASK